MSTGAVIFQQLINGLMLGVMYSLIAVGFSLYFGVMDIINFSHGDFFMLGAFVALILNGIFNHLGLTGTSPTLALFLIFTGSILITGLFGVVTERLCIKPISKSPPLITLLATMALGIVIREAVRTTYPRGSDPKSFPALLPAGHLEVGGVIIRYDNLLILTIGILFMLAVSLVITRTKMGCAIRATAQDPEAAMMMGLNTSKVIDATFMLGAGLAAAGGILNGLYYNEVMFNMGVMGGVIGFAAAVIGGLGNIYGAIIGGFILGLTETLAAAFLPLGAEYKTVFAFALVILFLIFKPTGILGEKEFERV